MNRKNGKQQSSKTLKKSINKKKIITLDTKLDILRRFASGEKAAHIGRTLNLSATTVKTICHRDAENIRKQFNAATCSQAKSTVMKRSSLIVRMESLLSTWIRRQTERKIPLSKMVIQAKAKSIYDDLQEKLPLSDKLTNENFSASNGWFERFKPRANLHNLCFKGESASADLVAARKFCDEIFPAVVHEGGYTAKQIFNVDETGLFWKRLPNRTYISTEEASAPEFKVSKDRLTLLLGGNANGDCKLKPYLVYHSENPRAMKGLDKNNLPVYWRSNNKAWITGTLFLDWVNQCAIPEFKKYCEAEKIEFKILVLLDNASGHPTYLDDLCENVKFLFLPPNTTSVIQPMDQGVISNFKAYYLRRTLKQLLNSTDADDNVTIRTFWKNYNLLNEVENIGESWKEVKQTCMNGVCRKIWPECIANDSDVDDVPVVRQEVLNIANRFNFEGVDEEGFNELIVLTEGTDESPQDLINLINNENENENSQEEILQEITSKSLANAMQIISEGVEIFLKEDSDNQRSAKVASDIKQAMSCYQTLYMEKKKKAIQATMDRYVQQQQEEIVLLD